MPWGMEYSGFDDFPIQTFQETSAGQTLGSPWGNEPTQRQDPFTSIFGNLFGQDRTPALSRYQDYLRHFPQQQDYTGGIGTKILAALAGFTSGLKDPAAGIQTAQNIMQSPYRQAVQQYGLQEPFLRQAASLEDKALGDKVNWLRAMQQGNLAQAEFGLKQKEFGLKQQEFGLDQQELALKQAQLKVDQAYKQGQLSNEQYQNATARINAMANQAQSAASANASNALAGLYTAKTQNPQAFLSGQNQNSLIDDKVKAGMMTDPAIAQYITKDGLDIQELRNDPVASARLNSLYTRLGLIPPQDIGLE